MVNTKNLLKNPSEMDELFLLLAIRKILRFPYLGNPSGDGADLVGAGASVMERKGAVLALRPDVCESREGGVLNAEEISSSAAGWVATDHALWRRTWGSGSVLL